MVNVSEIEIGQKAHELNQEILKSTQVYLTAEALSEPKARTVFNRRFRAVIAHAKNIHSISENFSKLRSSDADERKNLAFSGRLAPALFSQLRPTLRLMDLHLKKLRNPRKKPSMTKTLAVLRMAIAHSEINSKVQEFDHFLKTHNRKRLIALGATAQVLCHDMKNYFSPVLGHADMLLPHSDGNLRHHLNAIIEAGNKITDFSKTFGRLIPSLRRGLSDEERDVGLEHSGKVAATFFETIRPFSNIIGKRIELLESNELTLEQTKWITVMKKNHLLAHDLIDEFHSFHHPIPRNVEDIHLPGLVADALSAFGNKVTISPPGIVYSVPLILANRKDLHRIFTNLAKNSLEAGARNITYVIKQVNGHVVVYLSDNGKGIPKEVQGNLFKPGATYGKEGGQGLGLWGVRDLAVKNGGIVKIRSNTKGDRKGTFTSVAFPVKVK